MGDGASLADDDAHESEGSSSVGEEEEEEETEEDKVARLRSDWDEAGQALQALKKAGFRAGQAAFEAARKHRDDA